MEEIPESITRLVDDLKGTDEFAHSQAAFALGMLGTPAVPPLIDLLSHENADVRMRAAWALGVMGHPAVPALIELAEGDDKRLRIEAIRILGTIGEARTLNQLLIGLTDKEAHVAARAARAIGKIGDPRAYHALLTTLHHPVADVRYEACRALADLQVPDAAAILLDVAEKDTGKTSWGAQVADVARLSAAEVAYKSRDKLDEEFERVAELLQQHMQEKARETE